MSDSYDIDGVNVIPGAGGYYTLQHSSLGEDEKVRGKEAADNRAREIAKAATPPEGSMEPQGGLPPVPADQKPAPLAPDDPARPENAEASAAAQAAALEGAEPPKAGSEAKGDDAKDKRIKELEEQLAASQGQLAETAASNDKRFEAIEALIKTVGISQDGDTPPPSVAAVPRSFLGEMSAEGKKALKKAGLTYSTIVLEEGDHVPPTGLFVSHNGNGYQIQPGVEVDVPDFIIGVLDDARMSAPIMDSTTQKVLGYRDRSKYPYRKV